MASAASLKNACRDEILQLHDWFQDWFRGELPRSDAELDRVERVLAGDFRLVSPLGEVHTREALVETLRQAHGSRRAQFRIWIDEFEVRWESTHACLVIYEEWQEHQVATRLQTTVRLSTALFRRCDDAPNGVEWLHLQETWRREQPNTLR